MFSCTPNPTPLAPRPDEPPLHCAARAGDHAEIRRLLAGGEEPNRAWNIALDDDEWPRPATPLMVAAGSGDGASAETVRLLLELGADPRLQLDGHSAASYACTGLGWGYTPGGDAARLRLLLDAGSPLDISGREGSRLLCTVAAGGDADRLHLLIQRGASVNPVWDPEEARRDAAASRKAMERIREADPDQARFDQMLMERDPSALKRRAEEDREREESMCSAPYPEEIPLFRAAESGSAECVQMLLDAGAELRIRDNSRRTTMYFVGSETVARLLVERGLPVEDRNEYEWTPLTEAICDGEHALPRIRALLAAGADVNATHDNGYTVFMSAVGSGRHPEVLRLLVSAGADVHAVSGAGYNAFHAAIDVNFDANAEDSVRGTLGYLKELGVDLEHRNKAGLTPLGRAIQEGTALETRVLCELGANPNAVCAMLVCEGGTCTRIERPLLFHAAVGTGVDLDQKTESLLIAGANPLVRDGEGYTPLVLAVAELCQEADDYEGAYDRFFQGLHALRLPEGTIIRGPDDYVAVSRPLLRPFIQEFASPIPLRGQWNHEAQWREQLLTTIELLAAFEGWARQLVFMARARSEHPPPG